jgi:hypothetical protein
VYQFRHGDKSGGARLPISPRPQESEYKQPSAVNNPIAYAKFSFHLIEIYLLGFPIKILKSKIICVFQFRHRSKNFLWVFLFQNFILFLDAK